MAKAFNWNNFNQGFGESFNQTISELRRLREQREQFDQELGFKERQLNLENKRIEQTGRHYDQLDLARKFDIYQNLYPSQEGQTGAMTGGEIEKQFGADIYSPEQEKGFFSPYKPEIPKTEPLEKASIDFMPNIGYVETKTRDDVPYDFNLIKGLEKMGEGGSGDSGGGKPTDISGEVGGANRIIALMDSLKSDDDKVEFENDKGETVKVDKNFLRGEGKKFVTDMMTKSGVPLQGDLVTEIRQFAGVEEGENATIKRQKLLDAIDYVRSQKSINDTQYEALRYWANIFTR